MTRLVGSHLTSLADQQVFPSLICLLLRRRARSTIFSAHQQLTLSAVHARLCVYIIYRFNCLGEARRERLDVSLKAEGRRLLLDVDVLLLEVATA